MFDKADLEIDLENGYVNCPAGQTTETVYRTRNHNDRSVQRF
jgi:hypothetical protein